MDAAGLSDSNIYYAASKQGNIFSQSYNLSTNSYVAGGEFISVPNTIIEEDHIGSSTATSAMEDFEVSNSLQVTSMLSESKHWIVVQMPIAYMATNWPIRVSIIGRTSLCTLFSLFNTYTRFQQYSTVQLMCLAPILRLPADWALQCTQWSHVNGSCLATNHRRKILSLPAAYYGGTRLPLWDATVCCSKATKYDSIRKTVNWTIATLILCRWMHRLCWWICSKINW